MTPAALKAAMSGDMENFIAASTPGGIEAQEKRGQIEQSFAETLPNDLRDGRTEFERLGFVFGTPFDDIFVNVKFPAGWRKKPTEHSMWSEIIDDNGRKRGSIFYKAAFYDRHAHAYLERRFSVVEDYGSEFRTVLIQDACGKVQKSIPGLELPDWNGDRETARNVYAAIEEARNSLAAWLDEAFPDWKSPHAYWDYANSD